MPDMETRTIRGAVELRGSGDRTIGGYALKFGRTSRNLGGFKERILPEFPRKSQADGWPEVMARWNHDDAYLLGTTAGGTLRLAVDAIGLDYEVDLPSSRADLMELVTRGDVSRSSFAFYLYEDEWGETEDGFPLRTLVTGRIVDVAPVNTPAYTDTSTGLRSLAAHFAADPMEVRKLAEAGELRRLFHRSDTPAHPPQITPEDDAAPSTSALAREAARRRLALQK